MIKLRTRGVYSHTAIEIDGDVYEAWKAGVTKSNDPLAYHKSGTPIDTLEVYLDNSEEFKQFLEAQVGKRYDLLAILSFTGNGDAQDPEKWFCSELANMYFHFKFKELYKTSKKLVSPQILFEKLSIHINTLRLIEN